MPSRPDLLNRGDVDRSAAFSTSNSSVNEIKIHNYNLLKLKSNLKH